MILGLVQAFLASFSVEPISTSAIESQGEVKTVIKRGKVWQVWYNASFWIARSNVWIDLQEGDLIKVIGREGLTLIIEVWRDEDAHS